MKFKIIVKTNARKNEVRQSENGTLVVRVSVPPIEGRANEKVIEILAEYFGKPRRTVSIVSGFKSKNKTIEID
jgi:uncharacterized protein